MNALAETFDSLGYFERLKEAGVPEPQARVQADALRQQTEAQRVALQSALDRYDEASRRELATKGDIQDVRLEMKAMEMRLLKWQIGLAVSIVSFMLAGFGGLAAVMAKGFGWLGFN